jgi:hypothetical protein
MATANHQKEKIESLKKYAEGLEQRLRGPVPQRHAHRPEIFKKMVELDLKKTRAAIEKLSMG